MTKIQWVKNSDGTPGETWNPVTGCSPISEGCLNCYAKRLAEGRLRGRYGYLADDPFQVTIHRDKFGIPLKWKKPKIIFVCSMGDLFHENISLGTLTIIFDVIHDCPQHIFIILTKRPERVIPILYGKHGQGWRYMKEGTIIPNVWWGTTIESQNYLNRLDDLFKIPATVRFISAEPLRGPIDFGLGERWCNLDSDDHDCQTKADHIDWVIVGGETGSRVRPMHPDWVRSIRDQCKAANIPFFFKSWGKWIPHKSEHGGPYFSSNIPKSSFRKCEWKDGQKLILNSYESELGFFIKANNKIHKNILDGQTWNQIPEIK